MHEVLMKPRDLSVQTIEKKKVYICSRRHTLSHLTK